MLVKSIQRGFALAVAPLASAARRLSGALQSKTIGLPVVFNLVVTGVTTLGPAGLVLLQGGLRHG